MWYSYIYIYIIISNYIADAEGVNATEVHDTEVHDAEVHYTEVHYTEVHDTEVHDTEVHDTEVHDTEVNDADEINQQSYETILNKDDEVGVGTHLHAVNARYSYICTYK